MLAKTSGGQRKLFHDGGPYHIETNPWICSAKKEENYLRFGLHRIIKETIIDDRGLDTH